MNGLFMFVKYALPPNILGYCGPDTDLSNGDKHLLLQFEGAVPYLQLIASGNKIKDIFDRRVVEAYWLGNDLLKNVSDKNLYDNVESRFKKKMKNKDWSWLVLESIPKAKPHHVFHVFDIYRRAGLLKSGAVDNVLETMDKCRISWGKVIDSGLVEYNPLIFKDNKLEFGEKTVKKLISLDLSIKVGDEVSFHWNHICDKITPIQKQNLIFWTKYHLDLTNQTI